MTINEFKGVSQFDRTVKGFSGTGEGLKSEGAEDKPFEAGLLQQVIGVHWGARQPILGVTVFTVVGENDLLGAQIIRKNQDTDTLIVELVGA